MKRDKWRAGGNGARLAMAPDWRAESAGCWLRKPAVHDHGLSLPHRWTNLRDQGSDGGGTWRGKSEIVAAASGSPPSLSFHGDSGHIPGQNGRECPRQREKPIHPGGWSPSVKMGTSTAPRPCTRPWRGVGTRRAVEKHGVATCDYAGCAVGWAPYLPVSGPRGPTGQLRTPLDAHGSGGGGAAPRP
jgi:hypothetical protein